MPDAAVFSGKQRSEKPLHQELSVARYIRTRAWQPQRFASVDVHHLLLDAPKAVNDSRIP
jgi:hypothetical protein